MFTNYTEKLRLFNIIYGSLFPASVNINILHKTAPFLKRNNGRRLMARQ